MIFVTAFATGLLGLVAASSTIHRKDPKDVQTNDRVQSELQEKPLPTLPFPKLPRVSDLAFPATVNLGVDFEVLYDDVPSPEEEPLVLNLEVRRSISRHVDTSRITEEGSDTPIREYDRIRLPRTAARWMPIRPARTGAPGKPLKPTTTPHSPTATGTHSLNGRPWPVSTGAPKPTGLKTLTMPIQRKPIWSEHNDLHKPTTLVKSTSTHV